MTEATPSPPITEYRYEKRLWTSRFGRRIAALVLGALMAPIATPAHAQPAPDDMPRRVTRGEYVALGDSYASGEGNPPYEEGTDVPGVNECHRSEDAYPNIIAHDLGLRLIHVACSRVAPSGLFYEQWDENTSQLDHLSEGTKLVTISIGGNQVDMAGTLKECIVRTCGPGTPVYDDNMATFASDSFRELLKNIDEELLRRAPNAQKVLVVGYPKVDERDPAHPWCTIAGHDDDQAVADMIQALNDASRDVVREVDDPRLQFVYPPEHIGICSLTGRFNVYPVGGRLESLAHPNEQGHRDMAAAVFRQLNPPQD